MQTECSAELFAFAPVGRREVVGSFDGGTITSDAGALLLRATDRAIGLVKRLSRCFIDRRDQDLIEHSVETLTGQRVLGIALGYEDLNDHDELRHDPVMAVLADKLEARRANCAPVAGKSKSRSLLRSLSRGALHNAFQHRPKRSPAARDTRFTHLAALPGPREREDFLDMLSDKNCP